MVPRTRSRVWVSAACEFVRGLREIVAADRLVERARVARHNGDACPASGRTDALRIDERAQDRQRQIGVTGFNQSFEPRRLLGLSDRRKAPARLVDDLRYELCRHGMHVAKPITEFAGIMMF